MKAKIKNLTDEILGALAPVFKKHQDYDDIFNAMSLVMARVIQATPDKGTERRLREQSTMLVGDALQQFLALEEQYEAEQVAKKKAKAEIVAKGINGFTDLEPVGGHILSDVNFFPLQGPQPVIEPGSAADHPDNPNQNIAKTLKPWPETEDGCGEFGGPIAESGEIEEIAGYKVTKGEFGTVIRLDDEYTPGEGPYSQDGEPPEASQEAAPH